MGENWRTAILRSKFTGSYAPAKSKKSTSITSKKSEIMYNSRVFFIFRSKCRNLVARMTAITRTTLSPCLTTTSRSTTEEPFYPHKTKRRSTTLSAWTGRSLKICFHFIWSFWFPNAWTQPRRSSWSPNKSMLNSSRMNMKETSWWTVASFHKRIVIVDGINSYSNVLSNV